MRRLLPRSITAQLLLLLLAALVAAGVTTLLLLGGERRTALEGARRLAELERLAGLVPAIAALEGAERGRVARASSRRAVRIAVSDRPAVAEARRRLRRLERRFRAEVGESAQEVRIALATDRDEAEALPRRPRQMRRAGDILVSVRLPDGAWTNARIRAAPPRGGAVGLAVVASLGLALVFVLGVAFLFLRRITVPIARLTAAMRRAGEGDRTVTAPVAGAAETRDAASAFNAMQRDLARLEAERARTVAAVGHDLRTPITSLRIRAEMLDEATAEPMIRTLDEMRVMADSLLAWGREGRGAEASETVDLAALVRDVAAEHGLDAVVPAGTATVRGRPVALRRAFSNLADNARRYAGGGKARVSLEGERVVVEIADRGSGIEEDRLAVVMEPFVRGEDSRSRETGGSGLGLAIARDMISAHGGTLSLRNREGGGLLARVAVPRA